MVLMLKQCCCGCTLKTGALIIAVVFAILATLQVVLSSVGAVESAEHYAIWLGMMEIEEEERMSGTVMPSVDEFGRPLNDTSHDYHDHLEPYTHLSTRAKLSLIWMWSMILLSITETISFFLNILLMFAANKDCARQVLIWLYGFLATTCSRLVLLTIIYGAIFYSGAIVGGFIILTISALLTVGAAYSLLVVMSYYRQLVGTGIARRISRQDD